jgi:hypothetical protein
MKIDKIDRFLDDQRDDLDGSRPRSRESDPTAYKSSPHPALQEYLGL